MVAMDLLLRVTIICAYMAGRSHALKARSINKASAFHIITFNPDDETNTLNIKAANNSLYLGPSAQGACCNQLNAEDTATFRMENKELFLYSPGNPKQQVYVDYSADTANSTNTNNTTNCSGRVRYLIGNRPQPDNSNLSGWEIDDDDTLTFGGSSFIRCNTYSSTWEVLVQSSEGYPDGYDECQKITAKTSVIKSPTSCLYTGKHQVVSYYCL